MSICTKWLKLVLMGMLMGVFMPPCVAETATTRPLSAPDVSGSARPAWMTELAVGIQEGYDSNLFGVSGDGMPVRYSWLTTLTPKIGIDVAGLLQQPAILKVFTLQYELNLARFSADAEEDHTDHRLSCTINARTDSLTFNLENTFVYVDGSSTGAIYPAPDNVRSSFAHALPRDRRRQSQDRLKVSAQYDWSAFFLRPTGFLQVWDMLTEQQKSSGYQNWVDRYDINGGMDMGYHLFNQMAVFLGYRYGRLDQGEVITSAYRSSSDYHRALLGVEGKPWSWLTLSLAGGPDFRVYDDSAAVNDHHQVNFYGECALNARISDADTVNFKFQNNRWISSTGQVPTSDSRLELNYRHKFTQYLTWNLNGQIKNADYTVGNLTTGSAPSLRNDWLYSPSTRITCEITPHVEIYLSFLASLGRNAQDGLQDAAFREFDAYVTALGITGRF